MGVEPGRYPKSRIDKLGVKPGMRVALLGLKDAALLAELEERGASVAARLPRTADIVFVYLDRRESLPLLAKARPVIAPAGAVWAVWPKGRKEFREDDIRAFGPAAGLVDIKVMAFSETLSALKLVIPLRDRR
jgi:hypothetical protein